MAQLAYHAQGSGLIPSTAKTNNPPDFLESVLSRDGASGTFKSTQVTPLHFGTSEPGHRNLEHRQVSWLSLGLRRKQVDGGRADIRQGHLSGHHSGGRTWRKTELWLESGQPEKPTELRESPPGRGELRGIPSSKDKIYTEI